MKLFDTFEAVKFPEEDMIFITRGGYLYYIYNPKYKWWRKHSKQIIVIEIIFVLMFLTRMQIFSCKSLCTEQACACSVSYSAKESALRNSLGNSSFDLLHQCRKDALNDGEHIRLATVGSHIQTAVYLNHNGANICVTVQMLHRHHRP